MQLTAKGSIHIRDVQARQTKEQEKQHRQDDETQKQTQAQQRLAEALEQMRKDFVNYQAEQARKEIQNELEHAKINEKNRRSAWLQVIFTAIFQPSRGPLRRTLSGHSGLFPNAFSLLTFLLFVVAGQQIIQAAM